MDEVLGRLSAAAGGTGIGVTGLSDDSISVVSSDSGVVVVPDPRARTYRLEAPLPMTTDSGVVHESWSKVRQGPGASAGGFVGQQWTGRFSLTYDPKIRQWLADPSGRIDEFVRGALDPFGWKRVWTRNDRIATACVIGGLLLVLLFVIAVVLAIGLAADSPWVWAFLVGIVAYGVFMFWWGQIRGH